MDRQAIDMGYALFSRGDREGFIAMFMPDVVIHASGVLPGLDTVYRGHEGVRKWWDGLRESWERFELTHRVDIVDGDVCLVDVMVHGRGASSGAYVQQQVWHVVRMADTRICEHWSFWDRESAFSLFQDLKAARPG
jgi:uncharacterized protein